MDFFGSYYAEDRIKDSVSLKECHMKYVNKWFDANALWGQIAVFVFAASISLTDVVVSGKMPNLGVVALVGALLIVPPFLLPARGFDRSESIQKFIMTFGTTFFLGLIAGIAVAKGTGVDPKEDLLSVTLALAFVTSVAVLISYWTVGHMSRQFVLGHADYLAPMPEELNRLVTCLNLMGHQIMARDIVLAFGMFNESKLADLVEQSRPLLLESAIDEDHGRRLERAHSSAMWKVNLPAKNSN